MSNLEEFLKHHGVKGMRWGRRRDRNRPGGADGVSESEKVKTEKGMVVPKKESSKFAKNLSSMRRERQWSKILSEADKLSTKDISTVAKRVGLENELKTLSRTKGVGGKKDKADYLRRENMSDTELSRKVVRLRAKKSLHKNVSDATKEQREFGEKVYNIAKGMSLKFAVNRVTGKPLNVKDFYDVIDKPKDTAKNTQNELQKQIWEKLEKQNKP